MQGLNDSAWGVAVAFEIGQRLEAVLLNQGGAEQLQVIGRDFVKIQNPPLGLHGGRAAGSEHFLSRRQ